MADVEPRRPEQFQSPSSYDDEDFTVSELMSDAAGAHSPFGSDIEFPLPVSDLLYTHPSPTDRPHLAEGR